jgi:hypothetical protein
MGYFNCLGSYVFPLSLLTFYLHHLIATKAGRRRRKVRMHRIYTYFPVLRAFLLTRRENMRWVSQSQNILAIPGQRAGDYDEEMKLYR